jgi:hypothetical protein
MASEWVRWCLLSKTIDWPQGGSDVDVAVAVGRVVGMGVSVAGGLVGDTIAGDVGEAVDVGFNIAAVVGVEGSGGAATFGTSVCAVGEQAATALQRPKTVTIQKILQRCFISIISVLSMRALEHLKGECFPLST